MRALGLVKVRKVRTQKGSDANMTEGVLTVITVLPTVTIEVSVSG